MAAVFNGANRLAEQALIGGFVGGLSRFARHGPAYLLLLVMKPYWAVSGLNSREEADAREKLRRQVEAGVLPISILGLFAMIYLGLIFLL
jgi:hypothetical protein